MKLFIIFVVALISVSSSMAQRFDSDHMPTVEQCHADERAPWRTKGKNGPAPIGYIRTLRHDALTALDNEMILCAEFVDPAHSAKLEDDDSPDNYNYHLVQRLAMDEVFKRYQDFIEENGLHNKFAEWDARRVTKFP